MTGIQELLILMLVLAVLSATGLWPHVIRALRQLRGESMGGETPGRGVPPRAAATQEAEFCYKIMGLSPSAAWEEVERAYRAKARVHHPDHGGDADAMRALNDAYALLKRINANRR
jgi:hypothetical protein